MSSMMPPLPNLRASTREKNVERDAVSATVPAWRPLLGGAIILVGGAGALAYGAVRGELVYVLGTLGLTLLLAAFVDGTGVRYRGAGTGLMFVFVSAKVLQHLPRAFQRGAGYGALVALYGGYVVVRESANLRRRPPTRSAGSQVSGEVLT